jgi:transcriptional regulator with GAF, ATPase, and Fis domain
MDPTTEVGHTLEPGATASTSGRTPSLVLAWHPDPRFTGRSCPLPPGLRLELGRGGVAFGPGALDDPRLSRRHFAVESAADGQVLVTDLGSTNGTSFRGAPLGTRTLSVGACFIAGQCLFVVARGAGGDRPDVAADGPIGRSAALGAALDQVAMVAPRPTAVLLLGESGTGKEVFAREVHRRSGRKGPLVAVNCGGMADGVLQSELFGHVRGAFSGADRGRAGLVEQGRGGTLFLDEVGDASPALQVSLLRLLQEGEYRPVGGDEVRRAEIRCVAATNVDLEAAIAAGRFRQDLYTRLSRWVIRLPPLRERREDIPLLAQAFVERHRGAGARASRRFVEALLGAAWPGNVRELDAVIERACVAAPAGVDLLDPPEWLLASLTERATLPEEPSRPATPGLETPPSPPAAPPSRPRRPDAETLTRLLAEHGGEMKALARTLGIGRTTLYRWFEAAGLSPESIRE